MEHLDLEHGDQPFIGMASGPIVAPFLEGYPDLIDYVEVPFELFRHFPSAARIQEQIPVLLHCSSMSVAGFSGPSDATLDEIDGHARRTRSPWIGEHLAYLRAAPLDDERPDAEPTELTYTVCPQLSQETVDQVACNLARLRGRFGVPIILENPPQYFPVPGSTMTMPTFVAAVAEACDVGLLLDITHLLISVRNMGLDPVASLHELPLERVVEVHLSGLSRQSGRWWDDHAIPVPDEAFQLLADAGTRLRPRAVTFEYNWAPSMPERVVVSHCQRARELFTA